MALNTLAWVTSIVLAIVGGLLIGLLVNGFWLALLLSGVWGYICGRIGREIRYGR